MAGLLRGWSWSYPAALLALTGFVAYQIYRASHTHGLLLIALTIFDTVVIALIWHEWRVARRQHRDRRRLKGLAGPPRAPDPETPGTDA